MKKLFLMIVGIFLSVGLFASESTETIYLKDGSVINGMVVEEIPGVSVKVQTSDGSIILCLIDEVEKIAKEVLKPKTKVNKLGGYRGLIDVGYSFGVGTWDCNRFELLTTHGYQFNSYFYAGVGVGLNVWYFDQGRDIGFPFYAKIRYDILPQNKVCPFIDLNMGYSVGNIKGYYVAPSFGFRLAVAPKIGVNLSIGYTMQEADVITFDIYTGEIYGSDRINMGAIALRLGIDF